MLERYVNNAILSALSRPQYPEGCSIACLTTAVNCLFGAERALVKQEELAAALGVRVDDIGIAGGPGNEIVLGWFREYIEATGLQASCGVLLDRYDAKDESLSAALFEDVKEIIRNDETVLVYHLERHYNVVCGYVEHAAESRDVYDTEKPSRRWLVLADTSLRRDPVWSIRWQAVLEDFLNDRRHCILAFSRVRS